MNWLEPVYRRWLGQRDLLLADDRYVELRLEDAGADWPAVLPGLLARLGLPDDDQMLGFEPDLVRHRENQLSPPERMRVLDRFADIRTALNY
jgi:hypothetical protein